MMLYPKEKNKIGVVLIVHGLLKECHSWTSVNSSEATWEHAKLSLQPSTWIVVRLHTGNFQYSS